MNTKIIFGLLSFIISFLLVGVLMLTIDPFSASNDTDTEETNTTQETDDNEEVVEEESETEEASTSDGDNALVRNNCTACHAVSSLNIDGANTGPDLSNAFSSVEGKHGKPIEEFLVEPTSAVMSTVIADSPLSDEELEAVVNALEEADEAAN